MWIFNVLLYLLFLRGQVTGDYSAYLAFRAEGAACYVAAPWNPPTDPAPICPYAEVK